MSTTGAVERESEPDADGRWASVRDTPPSARLVAKILDYEGAFTQGQIAEESFLPPRIVRYALSRLESGGMVDSRFLFPDTHKRLYTLNI